MNQINNAIDNLKTYFDLNANFGKIQQINELTDIDKEMLNDGIEIDEKKLDKIKRALKLINQGYKKIIKELNLSPEESPEDFSLRIKTHKISFADRWKYYPDQN